ncbi:MAG: PaaI family thioesterase [Bacteroidota bacterium]|jgi:uncharacterized protein (TIGR00369 family)
MIEKIEWKAKDPDFKDKINLKAAKNYFMQDVGFKFQLVEVGYVETFLILEEKHLQQMGFVHGGVTATMADITTGFAAFTLVEKNESVVTVDLKVNYINPGKGEKLIAKAHVYKAGSKLIFCKTEIYIVNNSKTTQIAFADSIMAVLNENLVVNQK